MLSPSLSRGGRREGAKKESRERKRERGDACVIERGMRERKEGMRVAGARRRDREGRVRGGGKEENKERERERERKRERE